MGDFESYELVVKPRRDAKNKLLRTFFIILYVVFILLWLVFGFVTAFVPLLALAPITLWILIFFTWRYVNVEYEYTEGSGVITFTKIYNNRSRKKALVFDIRSAEYIALSSDPETERRVADYDPRREYSFVASKGAPDAYTALFLNENGDRCAVSFVADERIKRHLKMYNAAALKRDS